MYLRDVMIPKHAGTVRQNSLYLKLRNPKLFKLQMPFGIGHSILLSKRLNACSFDSAPIVAGMNPAKLLPCRNKNAKLLKLVNSFGM